MKKLLFLGIVALTGCLWADRTANQGWVAKNFAPSNLVTRVKALEDAPVAELDPVFEVWRNSETVAIGSASTADNSSVAVGMTSFSVGNGCVVVGKGSQALANGAIALGSDNFATGMGSIAIGSGATATAIGAVQIGGGGNSTANTLQFRGYQLVGADGKIPEERLPEITVTESDPVFSEWKSGGSIAVGTSATAATEGVAVGSGASTFGCGVSIGKNAKVTQVNGVAIGREAKATMSTAVAIGAGATASAMGAVQIGGGVNSTGGSLQFGNYQLLDGYGKIPADRLSPAVVLTAIQAMDDTQKAAVKTALGL